VTSPNLLEVVDLALRKHFGHSATRASVSFVGVEPIEVLRFEPIPGERAYVTLGMSRHPMTAASEMVQVSDGPRAELMLHLQDPADRFVDVWRQLAVLAAAPSVEGVVYAPGMTVDLSQPLAAGTLCTGVVVSESPLEPVVSDAAEVPVLLVTPATPNELAWARVRGSAALLERWTEHRTPLLDLERPQVDLD